MAIQNDAVTLEKTKDQSLLNQNAQEDLLEMQGLPSIAPPITYEMLEESETKEAAVSQDMIENLELWKSMTDEEMSQRIAEIYRRVEEELRAQDQT